MTNNRGISLCTIHLLNIITNVNKISLIIPFFFQAGFSGSPQTQPRRQVGAEQQGGISFLF
jgi:hypothetical protein